jgi:hypothetical protein
MNTINPLSGILQRFRLNRGLLWGFLIVASLISFELFNYSTTDFALGDLLGELRFASLRWSTILAIAFCGIDFAGIARLFTPGEGDRENVEVWYLFGAWLLAASMNAMLTWWGVSLALLGQRDLGNVVIDRSTLLKAVPVFVAVMVWLIRILIIGTFSVSGDRLFSQSYNRPALHRPANQGVGIARSAAVTTLRGNPNSMATSNSFRPAPKVTNQNNEAAYSRVDPSYHPVSMSASSPEAHTRH